MTREIEEEKEKSKKILAIQCLLNLLRPSYHISIDMHFELNDFYQETRSLEQSGRQPRCFQRTSESVLFSLYPAASKLKLLQHISDEDDLGLS